MPKHYWLITVKNEELNNPETFTIDKNPVDWLIELKDRNVVLLNQLKVVTEKQFDRLEEIYG